MVNQSIAKNSNQTAEATNKLVQVQINHSDIQANQSANSDRNLDATKFSSLLNRSVRLRDPGDREIILNVQEIAAASVPIVQEINTDGSTVHFGLEFDSVEGTVFTEEVVKDQVFELKTPRKNNSIRCSVIVFALCAFITGSGLAHHYIKYALLPRWKPIIELGLDEWWYIRREDWQARPYRNRTLLNLPIRYVIIGHSGKNTCHDKASCIEEVQAMQYHDQNINLLHDIGPNFLISGEGLVFEGRGASIEGNMIEHYDFRSITVKFLGDYHTKGTVREQFYHLNEVLTQLVQKGVLRHDYQITGHCQMDPNVSSPGINVIFGLSNLSHWWPYNWEMCFENRSYNRL